MLHDPPLDAAVNDIARGAFWSGTRLVEERDMRAAAMFRAGVGPGDCVALAYGGTASFFADLFAVWSLGATAACLDPDLTPDERERVFAFLDPVGVVDGNGLSMRRTATGQDRPQRLDDPALILFTSGTSGDPKGVVLSFRAILSRLSLNAAEIGVPTLARTLVTLPTHFGHGLIGNALTAIHAGGTIVLPPRGLPLARRLGPILDEHGITFMSSVPTLWRIALKMSSPPMAGSLVRVHVGSAPLSSQLWQEIASWCGAEVVNCYGITETANWIGGASSRSGFTDGLVGRPWGGRVAVLATDGKMASIGEGEIAVLTPSLMTGYFKRDDLTTAAFHNGWYRTGDWGEVDSTGAVRLTGRIKDEINRAGFKVQPAEIDHLVEQHPDVEEACTFGVPDSISGEIVAVAVRRVNGAGIDGEGLRQWLLARVRREAAPERFYFVDEIPRTVRGKVSRIAVCRALTGTAGE